jgi:glycosyltransferase involved in cell wall biosynthesis
LPIFAELRQHGYEFAVLQFTWGDQAKSEEAKSACEESGVPYRRVDVWRTGALGALATSAFGGRHVDRAVREWNIDALMPRSLQPALSALLSRSAKRLPIIFDADGLPADERFEFGRFRRRGFVYRILRAIERRTVRRAHAVLVRTEAAIEILRERSGPGISASNFHVVTNGRDPRPFLSSVQVEDDHKELRLCYIGSVGPQYRTAEMIRLADRIRAQFLDVTLHLFTGALGDAATILAEAGFDGADWIELKTLSPAAVPAAIASCDVGFALRQPSLSMSAVAPVKLGDYLLAGVPIIGTASIGPVAEALASGCMISADRPIDEIVNWVNSVLAYRARWRERCRKLGIRYFSIARSIEQYATALESMARTRKALA